MIVCADDYGLAGDIDQAILDLCDSGRLSAVSCMVLLQKCSRAALAQLTKYQSTTDIGLHLCLTDEGLPLSAPLANPLRPFGPLLRRALAGRLNALEAASLIAVQYDLFIEKAGRPPDYIDGHLHAHQLPGIREGLLSFVRSLP